MLFFDKLTSIKNTCGSISLTRIGFNLITSNENSVKSLIFFLLQTPVSDYANTPSPDVQRRPHNPRLQLLPDETGTVWTESQVLAAMDELEVK